MNRAIACLSALLALTACAASADYPSLARRPAERITGTADVVEPAPRPTPPPAPPSAEIKARLAQLVEQAAAAHRSFEAKRANAERLVNGASGAATGSETWSVASVALADLEAARSDAMVALGELDEIYTAESVKASETGATGDAEAAQAAHAQVDALLGEEDAVLQRLRGRI